MPHVVDTGALLDEGLISPSLAEEIARRSRETMVALAVNSVLCVGIIAATFGLIFWLADAMAVAVAGGIFLAIGLWVLLAGGTLYRMLGNAAALVGAGMLIGGAGIELVDKYEEIAEPIMIIGGGAIVLGALWAFLKGRAKIAFVSGAILLMGLALHIAGLGLAMEDVSGWLTVAFYGYVALAIAAAGWLIDVRLVTALAIAPFAQMLDTGTAYFHAAYVFYSPEPTLTILQMAALIGVCLWVTNKVSARTGRHLGILAILAAVVGNLAFLVGSLWGDHVAISYFDGPVFDYSTQWTEERQTLFEAEREAFEARFITISEHVFTAVWAVLLGLGAFWAAHANRRGLFNAAMTFGGIHAYTQMFESYGDEPLAWALGGLAAIPLAWGLWQLNQRWIAGQAEA